MKISRRNLSRLLLFSGFGLAAPNLFSQDNNSLNAEFADWLQQQKDEFADFNTFYAQAFQDYAAGIAVNWGANPILRNQTLWVDYSKTVRRMINFDQGFAEVAIIRQRNSQSLSQLARQAKRIIKQLFGSSINRILAADPLEQRINKKIQKSDFEVMDFARKNIKNTAVFSSVAPEKSTVEQAEAKEETLPNGKTIVTVRVPIKNDSASKRTPFFAAIQTHAKRYSLPPALISAVMEAESAFNPLATSSVPAYGLMQIVPVSAGVDIALYLYQKRYLLSPDWLYDATNNILAGSTYLRLLQSRYLKAIKNSKSKLHCVIASYNTGTGNMARAFSSKGLTDAIDKINKTSPAKVYNNLVKKLPYQETRDYLEKVTGYIEKWAESNF